MQVRRYGKRKVLGILDIYGFEVLEHNGFEQFIINFCNEKLQQAVAELTLRLRQEEYVREGIEWTPVEFFNNAPICDLIEKVLRLFLCCWDSHSLMPVLTDRESRVLQGLLRHYAGTVTYCVAGFVEKNCDSLPRDLSLAMFRCEHPLLKSLFPEGNPKRTTLKRPATAGTQFKISVGALMRNLQSKTPHFVRCVKPNELKQPRIFELALVQHQEWQIGNTRLFKGKKHLWCLYRVAREEYRELKRRKQIEWAVTIIQRHWIHWKEKMLSLTVPTLTVGIGAGGIQTTEIGGSGGLCAEVMARVAVSQTVSADAAKSNRDRLGLALLEGELTSGSMTSTFARENFFCGQVSSMCHRYRLRFDQTARNRMREKVTASIIFKDRKASYPR
ncbi:hypothetical protein B566_EDAN012422, partial [Ephemera danica]